MIYTLFWYAATGTAPIRTSLIIPPAQPTVIAKTITPKKSIFLLIALVAPLRAKTKVPKTSNNKRILLFIIA